MYRRLLQPPTQSAFLLGMRGVGKSTWAAEHFGTATKIDLLREATYQAHLADARLFRESLAHLAPQKWVVVDEIQRLPSLLNEVHSLIEERRLKFLLLGSSARKLRRAGVNLLGGRALRLRLAPLQPEELGANFSLHDMMRFGSLPLILVAENRSAQLEAYVELYLKEEIHAEALVRNLPGFSRFLRVAALFHGQVLNVESLARDVGVARTTVQGFLDILEDTLIASRLPAFESRLRVKEKRHPKLYWLDNGVMRAAKRNFAEVAEEERGALFEGIVAQCLWASHDLKKLDFDQLAYWAVGGTQHVEVDFVISNGKDVIAIEAKATQRLRSEHFVGLKAIEPLSGLKRRILLYEGEDSRISDGIEVWPFARFLEALSNQTLIG